ncbi:MAG: CoA pyrophosphatase [Micrococcales bacterium]|nr:CoA pyrophosphatase [Micrococcales bacterium]
MAEPHDALRGLISNPVALPAPWRSLTGTPSRRSAVLVLFGELDTARRPARAAADLDVLLQRRADDLDHHPGQVAFPGGGLDPGETPEQAALREAVEETGLDPGGVEVVGSLPALPLTVSDNLVTPVLAWWTRPSPVASVDPETTAVFRVPVADLLNPAHRVTARRGTLRTPAFVLDDGALVWGFTAMVLSGLFDALGWTLPWNPRARVIDPTVGRRT